MDAHQLRSAGPEDAPALSRLAQETFRATYGTLEPHRLEMIEAYVGSELCEARVREELADARVSYFLLAEGGQAVGYAKLLVGDPPAAVACRPSVQLERIYLDRPAQGRGLGKRFLELLRDHARARGFRSIWLGVYEGNPGAIRFYEANGFRKVGEAEWRYSWGEQAYADIDVLFEAPL
jgi:diamine N-acetyltransferase